MSMTVSVFQKLSVIKYNGDILDLLKINVLVITLANLFLLASDDALVCVHCTEHDLPVDVL